MREQPGLAQEAGAKAGGRDEHWDVVDAVLIVPGVQDPGGARRVGQLHTSESISASEQN